jgi:HSP20 family molecular chaperone IbpA
MVNAQVKLFEHKKGTQTYDILVEVPGVELISLTIDRSNNTAFVDTYPVKQKSG